MRRINALMNSMHRRIRAVTDARGGHTRLLTSYGNRFHFNILGGGTVKLVSIKKILTNSDYMGPGVILLEN
jgi:hypothetical protein